jgi:protein-disulfide isomerase
VQIGAVLGVAVDAYLGFRMSQIGALCPFCAFTYVMNLLLLIGSTLELRGKDINYSSTLQGDGSTAVVVGLVGLVLGIAATGSGSSSEPGKAASGGPVTASDLAGTYEQTQGPIHYEPNDPVEGNPNGKYILVEWADFQCPHCKARFPELKKVIEQNPDVQLHYKNYPISQNCNHFVEWEGHKDACNAAAAGVCANIQNAFWPLAEKMFQNQEYLGKDDIRFMAQQVGLDMTAFETCMSDPATAAAVKEDVEAGGLANIHGTPSIFLKGAFGDQWVTIKGGADAINNLLAVSRAGGNLPPPPPPSPDE